jgi:hypothetical protein
MTLKPGESANIAVRLPSSCDTYTVLPLGTKVKPGKTTMIIAVSDNFYKPMLYVAAEMLAKPENSGKTFTICVNTHDVILADMKAHPNVYDMFFDAGEDWDKSVLYKPFIHDNGELLDRHNF